MSVSTELPKTLQLTQQAQSFFLSLWDSSTGGFRFALHQPVTLMATSYCVLGLEFVGGLGNLTSAQKTAIVEFLMSGVQADGSFRDPLFSPDDILSSSHDLAYFEEETTTFCQQALDALQAPPPPLRDFETLGWDMGDRLIQYFESIPWENPWLDSNRVMFALSQLCHDAERHQQPQLLTIVDTGLDWLDAHQSEETGLWKGQHDVPLTNAMAATFHFTFYYGYRRRPLLQVERIIDSCLTLQEAHGLFSGNAVGQTCLDYDALDLMAKAALVTNYRFDDVQTAMERAYNALLGLHNPSDGGFANCKEYVMHQPMGRKAKFLRKIGLAKFAPTSIRVPANGRYDICWRLLSCETSQSNPFSTWFRLLGLRLSTQDEWLNTTSASEFTFRRLPFLGYHNPSAIVDSAKKLSFQSS